MDTMYFGDEDPHLIADMKKTRITDLLSPIASSQPDPSPAPPVHHQDPPDSTCPQGEGESQSDQVLENRSDQVLLYNEASGEFEYCSTSGGSSNPSDSSDRSAEGKEKEGVAEGGTQVVIMVLACHLVMVKPLGRLFVAFFWC